VIQAGGTTINFANGFSSTAGLTLNGNAKASNDSPFAMDRWRLERGEQRVLEYADQYPGVYHEVLRSNCQLGGRPTDLRSPFKTLSRRRSAGASSGLGYQNIGQSVAIKFNFYNYENEGSDSTGFYTDGEPPVMPTVDNSDPRESN